MTQLARLLFLTLCGMILCRAAFSGQQEALENLRKRIATVQQEMEKVGESKAEVADSLRESERSISNCNRRLAEITAQQNVADHKLNQLQKQQQKLNSDITKNQVLLSTILYQQYLSGNQEYSKLLLNGQNPSQISRNMLYYQFIARSRAAWLTNLRNDLAELNTVSNAAREQLATLTSLRSEQAAQKKSLEKEQHARKRMLIKISHQLRQQRREISHLQRNENRLAELVEKIANMLAQPKALFRNDDLPDDRFDGNPFDQLKGKLTLPVKGVVTNRFGAARPDGPVSWKGLFLKSSSGQPVKAIAAGRVVFADWLRGFGNLLIVDHGKGYMSLYGNNETLYKQVGDKLRGGDTIAAVGNSGGNEDFGLYFELRHESKPLDPMKWMASK